MIYRRRLTRAELRQRANHKMISGSWNDGEENEHETQLKKQKKYWSMDNTYFRHLCVDLIYFFAFLEFVSLFSVTKGTKFMSYKEKSNHD